MNSRLHLLLQAVRSLSLDSSDMCLSWVSLSRLSLSLFLSPTLCHRSLCLSLSLYVSGCLSLAVSLWLSLSPLSLSLSLSLAPLSLSLSLSLSLAPLSLSLSLSLSPLSISLSLSLYVSLSLSLFSCLSLSLSVSLSGASPHCYYQILHSLWGGGGGFRVRLGDPLILGNFVL